MSSLMKVGVVVAGAMGAGIAQVAAQFGHEVLLADAFPAALPRARAGHEKAVARDVEKGRLSREAGDATLQRLTYVDGVGPESLAAFADCGIVIEAIVEQLTTIPGSSVKLKLEIDAEVPSGLDRAKVRTLVENANTLGFIDKAVE